MAANKAHRTDPRLLELEAEGERAQAALVAEGTDRLGERCPQCGALGSLEAFGDETRCIDCDEVVAATTRLGGFGRR
jgi:hypothetical protein